MLESGLELAANPAERADWLRKDVQLAEDVQKIVEARFRAGQASQAEALQAQIAVLEARIRLLREDNKADPK